MLIKVRAQQITIDAPRSSAEPWMNVVVQKVFFDENTNEEIQVVDRYSMINKRLSVVANLIVPYTDPVTSIAGLISATGINSALTEIVNTWLITEFNGVLTNGDIIVES